MVFRLILISLIWIDLFKSSHIEKFDQKFENYIDLPFEKGGVRINIWYWLFWLYCVFYFADLQVFVAQYTTGQALIPIERYTVQYNFHLEKGSPLHLEKGLLKKRLGTSHLEKGILKKIPFSKATSHQGRSLGHEGRFVLPIPLKKVFWHVSHPCPWKRMWSSR